MTMSDRDDVPPGSSEPVPPPVPQWAPAYLPPPAWPTWPPPPTAPDATPRPPQVWPAIVVPVLATITALILASVALLAAYAMDAGLSGLRDQAAFMEWVKAFG